ncbi:uncharacterized protein LOC132276460 [Cornus florida]|uniref:uncharacterized protein LOC132276460 n=1 Tax=Cornus florida TaxID=4283 RepID=UPI00289EE615|nr:uncharacterized protein LOC132276460 [Cornus florida]
MADLDSFNKPHHRVPAPTSPLQPNSSKSYSYTQIICKSLIVVFVLVLLPLFPSQAPEFINQTILTKLWDLFRLLFIGIAVCYGLFSRRHVQKNTESYSKIDNSQTYLSGILHVSSIFEDGFENPCGSDEKRVIQAWNSQYSQSESMVGVTNGSSILDEWNDPRSSLPKNRLENSSGSRYFQGETMFVAAHSDHVIDQWGKPGPSIDYKPLNLPIRSLRSRIVDSDTSDSFKGSGSSSSLKGSSNSSSKSGDKIRKGKVRGMVPIKLDEKFEESDVLSSPVPWRSRSGRMDFRGEGDSVKPPSHSRFLSVGEFELEHLKSQSFRSSIPSGSSFGSSPKKVSPSSSVYSVPNSDMEGLERERSCLYGSSEPTSQTQSAPISGDTSFFTSKAQGFSIGSFSDMNLDRSSKDNLENFGMGKRDDPVSRGKWGVDSLSSNVEPTTTIVKGLSRGKSVRRIRASENVVTMTRRKTGDICANHTDDDMVRKAHYNCEASSKGNTKRTAEDENSMLDNQKPNLGNLKGEKQNFDDDSSNITIESEEDSDSEFGNFRVSSDEEAEVESDIINDAGLDPNEVDRKAAEFIAKFREQIRLQKIASSKGPSGW